MSLDKAIRHGKEHREPYIGGKSIFKSCRNHGGCAWCERNRKYRYLRQAQRCDFDENEYKRGDNIDFNI